MIFESASANKNALEALIEGALPDKLGFRSTTIVYTQEELQRLVNSKPFGKMQEGPSSRLNVTFLKKRPKAGTLRDSTVGVNGRAVCTAVNPTNMKTPDLMLSMEKQFGKETTTRTWKTVNKILEKLEEEK